MATVKERAAELWALLPRRAQSRTSQENIEDVLTVLAGRDSVAIMRDHPDGPSCDLIEGAEVYPPGTLLYPD